MGFNVVYVCICPLGGGGGVMVTANKHQLKVFFLLFIYAPKLTKIHTVTITVTYIAILVNFIISPDELTNDH